ncbi:MAG TPA: transglutaminase-like domain-containing protein [Myxococcales bacterium]|nr:transglutaminase-like domain-containing protein [Myxococcales bacterium]
MKRRDLLGAAVVAALPWRHLRAEPPRPEPGWRTFEVTTRAEIFQPEGVSRAWLPLPLATATDWQRTLGNTWNGNASRMEEVRTGKYGVSMLYVEWAAGTQGPFVELKSKLSTRDRAISLTQAAAPSLSREEIALYTAPTESIPCDGLVRETALMRAAKGARTDLEKGRALYEWIVQNTMRDPKTRGCGTGNIKAMLESGNLGGKCADLNGLFVGFCRSLGIPARDVYGIRVASSAFGYKSLGASSPLISKAQHCRAEFFAEGIGWVPVDPADVRKVILEEPPGNLTLQDPKVEAAHKRLFGSWEMNWIAWNAGHDVQLPNSTGPKLPFLMYPNGETSGERLDQLEPDKFKYTITAREI